MKILEIVFGNSCYRTMRDSSLRSNNILLFNLLLNVGDLSKIKEYKINIPDELCNENSNYSFEKEIVMIDSSKPILCDKAIYYKEKFFMDKFKAVSKSLAKIKTIPSQQELEEAIINGECNVSIPIQNFNTKGEKNVS